MVLFVISSVSAPLLLFDTNYVLFSISFIYCVALVYHVLRSLFLCIFHNLKVFVPDERLLYIFDVIEVH